MVGYSGINTEVERQKIIQKISSYEVMGKVGDKVQRVNIGVAVGDMNRSA